MEQMMERKPDPEPVLFSRNIEETHKRVTTEAQLVATLPRVLKPADTPWKVGIQAFTRNWISGVPKDRLTRAAIRTFGVNEQMLDPGMKGGRHRHVREAIFYVIEGKGYEIHDGKQYDWEAGDIMTVPSYCDHQHFNPNPIQKARMFFAVPTVVEFMGIHWVEQIEMRAGYAMPTEAQVTRDAERRVTGYKKSDGYEFKMGFDPTIQQRINSRLENVIHIDKPRDTYEGYIKLLEDEVKWRAAAPHVVKNKDVPWEDTRMGRIKFMCNPNRNSGLKVFDAFIQEIAPEGSSGKHRHAAEEVHKILQGKGYDVHDGVRHDWEAEDVVCIPPYVTHQHFNSDATRPARFVALQSNFYAFIGHGGIEHLEDAPGYQNA